MSLTSYFLYFFVNENNSKEDKALSFTCHQKCKQTVKYRLLNIKGLLERHSNNRNITDVCKYMKSQRSLSFFIVLGDSTCNQ